MYKAWENKYTVGNIEFCGNADSARHSGFWFNKYKLLLDAGIPSVGYSFYEIRNKLKPEYKHKTKNEIRELSKNKVNVSESIDVPIFAYTGYITNEVFLNKDVPWNEFKLIITECTFINDLTFSENANELANIKKHNSFEYILPIIQKHKNATFALCHWSTRYKIDDLRLFFKLKNIANIIPIIDSHNCI